MRARRVRVRSDWPVPAQSGQGSSTTMPRPRQSRQGSAKANPPALRLDMPVPLQRGQTRGLVPGLAPVPRQVRQAPVPASWIGTVTPLSASPNANVTSASRSAPRRGGLGPTAAAEHAAEDVAEAAGPTARAAAPEEVGQVERDATAGAARAAGHAEAARAEQRARLVVLLALRRVGQHVVGLGDLLEPLLGLRVPGIGVGVVGAGQLAVGLLDVGLARVLGDAEGGVVVLLDVVARAHRRPSSLSSRWPRRQAPGLGPGLGPRLGLDDRDPRGAQRRARPAR